MDGKKMQDLYIHNIVSVKHIILLTEMKMKEKKKGEKTGFYTNKRIKGTWHAPNTARKSTVGEKTKTTTTTESWLVTSSKHQLETIVRTA